VLVPAGRRAGEDQDAAGTKHALDRGKRVAPSGVVLEALGGDHGGEALVATEGVSGGDDVDTGARREVDADVRVGAREQVAHGAVDVEAADLEQRTVERVEGGGALDERALLRMCYCATS
jgi:hypothetical protein